MTLWPQQQIQEVADGILVVLHGRGEAGIANAACVFEQDQALVVDTMTFPEMSEGLINAIARRSAHVNAVLNTHHHIDHTGGNRAFAGTPIVAHARTVHELERMADLPASFYDQLLPHFRGHFTDLQIQLPDTAPDQFALPQGGELHAFQGAHSPADLAVWIPRSRVLLAGDLSFIGVTPMAAHGLLSRWIKALDHLIELRPAVVVPGHGRVGGVQDLIDLRAYFQAVFSMAQRVVNAELTPEEALSTLDCGPVTDWIEGGRSRLNLERGIAELRGEISPDKLVVPKVPTQPTHATNSNSN